MHKKNNGNLPLYLEIRKENKTYTFYNKREIFSHTEIVPYGYGIEAAVLQLGEYPSGTRFDWYDQFDGLTIFKIYNNGKTRYLSIWNRDLIECFKRSYILSEGIEITNISNDDYFYPGGNFKIKFSNSYMVTTDTLERAAKTCHKTRELFFNWRKGKSGQKNCFLKY